MSFTWKQLKRTVGIALPTSAAVMALGGGAAWAADIVETCPSYVANAATCVSSYTGCFRFDGSDTLTEVVQNGINKSGACLSYHNIGSGQGETNISSTTGTTIQSIAPMSRNFKSSITGIPVTVTNVVGLDAPVVTFSTLGSTLCQDVSPGYTTSQDLAPIDNLLARALSGYKADGVVSEGLTKQCADPKRITALAALASCQGVDRIEHILRRDDKSGTQDTFREHLQFQYWCNGNSPGNTNAAGSNLKNEDLDPIRRPCVGADSTKAQTRCTYYPSVTTCQAGDGQKDLGAPYGKVDCTQGVVVAISENDPTARDITKSIGRRVGLDLTYRTIGLAGLASHDPVDLKSSGATVNTNTYEVDNIRLKAYMLARRLFIMGPKATTNTQRNAEELKFFNYVTSNCGIQQIVTDAGFVLPQDGVCGNTPCPDISGNPLACGPADSAPSLATQNIGWGEASGSTKCVNDFSSSGTCPDLTPKLAAGYACATNGICASNNCGTVLQTTNVCN
jgi:hypothetical protein